MRKKLLSRLKCISLITLLLFAGINIILVFKARETPAHAYTDPFSGNIMCIQPMGDVEPDKLEIIKEIIESNFTNEIHILPSEKLKRSHRVRARNQYDASKIMSWAKANVPEEAFRYIIVVDEDIFARRLNYVFGLAQIRGKVCIISLERFAESDRGLTSKERPLFKKRMMNLLLHELGHTMGLMHCPSKECVMHFSNSLVELDNQSVHYCPECLERLRWLGVLNVFTETGDAVTYLYPRTLTGDIDGHTIR